MNSTKLMVAALVLLSSAALATAAPDTPEEAPVAVVKPAPAGPVVAAPPANPEEEALLQIQAEGRAAVAKLVEQLQASVDPQSRLQIQRQIEAAKLANRTQFLQKIVEFAEAKGNTTKANEAREVLRIMTEGLQASHPAVSRPVPPVSNGGK